MRHGVDEERLLPPRAKHAQQLAKELDRELDRNGFRMFVSGAAHTLAHGKAPQRRNAEAQLVAEVTRWLQTVRDLLPEREDDLQALVQAGLDRPEALPKRE